jgi:hypothetical protein
VRQEHAHQGELESLRVEEQSWSFWGAIPDDSGAAKADSKLHHRNRNEPLLRCVIVGVHGMSVERTSF